MKAIRFPYYITKPMTHRSILLRRSMSPVRKNMGYHVAIISMLLLLAAHAIFKDAALRAKVILVLIFCQILMFQVTGIGLFFQIRKRKRMLHSGNSPLAGKTLRIKPDVPILGGMMIRIENWVDQMTGKKSWLDYDFNNKAVMMYSLRKGSEYQENDPEVDEVLYGHIDNLGHCVHISELEIPDNESPGTI